MVVVVVVVVLLLLLVVFAAVVVAVGAKREKRMNKLKEYIYILIYIYIEREREGMREREETRERENEKTRDEKSTIEFLQPPSPPLALTQHQASTKSGLPQPAVVSEGSHEIFTEPAPAGTYQPPLSVSHVRGNNGKTYKKVSMPVSLVGALRPSQHAGGGGGPFVHTSHGLPRNRMLVRGVTSMAKVAAALVTKAWPADLLPHEGQRLGPDKHDQQQHAHARAATIHGGGACTARTRTHTHTHTHTQTHTHTPRSQAYTATPGGPRAGSYTSRSPPRNTASPLRQSHAGGGGGGGGGGDGARKHDRGDDESLALVASKISLQHSHSQPLHEVEPNFEVSRALRDGLHAQLRYMRLEASESTQTF